MRTIMAVVASMLLAAPLAHAQGMAPAADKPACAAMDKDLPADLAAWTTRAPLTSAARAADLSTATLLPGHAVDAALHPTPEITYLAQPEKPGGSVSQGGLFQLDVAEAGTYRIILGAGPWIDVLKDGQAVVSSAHAPGPACSTARKTVDFPLEKGRYVIQISASAAPKLAILVARRP